MRRGDCLPRVLPARLGHPPPPRQEDAQALPSPPQRHLPLWWVRHRNLMLNITILNTGQILRRECAAHELRCWGSLCCKVASWYWSRHWQVRKDLSQFILWCQMVCLSIETKTKADIWRIAEHWERSTNTDYAVSKVQLQCIREIERKWNPMGKVLNFLGKAAF